MLSTSKDSVPLLLATKKNPSEWRVWHRFIFFLNWIILKKKMLSWFSLWNLLPNHRLSTIWEWCRETRLTIRCWPGQISCSEESVYPCWRPRPMRLLLFDLCTGQTRWTHSVCLFVFSLCDVATSHQSYLDWARLSARPRQRACLQLLPDFAF